jgi:hypothetical protein
MLITQAGKTMGATKLLAYVRATSKTIPRFCEENGLNRIKTQKAINGDLQRIDVGFALDIEKATGGAVLVRDWVVAIADAPKKRAKRSAA